MSAQIAEWLDVVAKVLLRCWILGFLILVIWFAVFMLAPQVIYDVHGPMFGLSAQGLNLIHYCGMGLVKLIVLCFFFAPWVSIRLLLRKVQ